MARAELTVSGLFLYPVKGFRGHAVAQARVEPWGLAGDRRWVDAARMPAEGGSAWRFLTQRQHPAMARVDAALTPGGLALSLDGLGRVDVAEPGPQAARETVTVWKDVIEAPGAPEADAWLAQALGLPCRLFHMDAPEDARPVDPTFANPDDRVSFADGFPVLVTQEASLADLNARLPAPVPMDRFRPNIVVAGGTPWGEDAWTRVEVGAVPFRAPKPCGRCVVTTVDQASGAKAADSEPLRTLAGFRRDGAGRVVFGQNLIPDAEGVIRVGDAVGV